MVNVNKLKGRMVECGITQEELAEALRISRSRMNAKLNQASGEILSLMEAERIIEVLKIKDPLEYFFYSDVADTQHRRKEEQ